MPSRILPPFAARARGPLLATLLAAFVAGSPAQEAAEPAVSIVPTPRALTLPVLPASRPFLSAGAAAQPVDLAMRGYVEHEYLVTGVARPGAGGAPAKYATRLLVRRPAGATRFSGLAVVEALDAAELHDAAPVWGAAHEEILRSGHVWVGVTWHAAAGAALRAFDASRYEKLSLTAALPAGCVPPPGLPGAPETLGDVAAPPDAGLGWDVLAQAGALLRSGSRENPLAGLEPRHVVAAGFARGASALVTFINARHASARLGDGSPVYDGYLLVGGGLWHTPLDPCADGAAAAEERRVPLRVDVPVISMGTESEVTRTLSQRLPDSDDPRGAFRRYEIAGASLAVPAAGLPGTRELEVLRAGAGAPEWPCEEPPAEFPIALAVGTALNHLQQWVAGGKAPPRLPLLSVDADSLLVRDALGAAVGGWRLPQMSVPSMVWTGRSTPRRADDAAQVYRCSLAGTVRRLDDAELKGLHGSRTEYLRRFNEAVDQAVSAGMLLPADAAGLKATAARGVPAF